MKQLLYSLLLMCVAGHAIAAPTEHEPSELSNPMVADASQDAIEIRTSFNGAQLLVFGARNIPGEMVIAVRGPSGKITVRRKERIAGMWMHVEQQKYHQIPLFYALASTKPLKDIAAPSTLATLGLGVDQITFASHSKPNETFDAALDIALERKRWWQEPFNQISYFGESLFKAKLDMPDSLPGGNYTAEVYLFDGGALKAMQTIPITVYKTGLEASLVRSAEENGLAYGLIAVLMALFGGWLAHRLFHRP